MYTKAAFLKSLAHETKIIKHLAAQVPAGQADFRLTPPQRSTIELLRYLCIVLIASSEYAVTQSWDKWEQHDASVKELPPEGVAKAMDKQFKAVTKLLATYNDAALKKKTTKAWTTGKKVTLGEGLVEMVLKPAVAYRMQLFLQVKASGAPQLATSDCWQGKAAKAVPST